LRAEREAAEGPLLDAAGAGDWPKAWSIVKAFLDKHPDDALMNFNAACVKSQLGDLDAAFAHLDRAIDFGFADLGSAAGDPDLAPMRDDSRWPALRARLAAKDAPASRRSQLGQNAFDAWKKKYGDRRYTYLEDDARKLRYAVALDDTSCTQMRQMLDRQCDWCISQFFESGPNDPVLIAIPHPLDFKDFFDGPNLAGVYEHGHRRLVSRDTGASLRHEFVHLLHWGHMDRIRQVHPVWIQEGLASLFEDYEWDDHGNPAFRPNIRHNLARGAAVHGNAPPWPRFFATSYAAFMNKAELNYALSRSIFEFMAERGRLQAWYRDYTAGFERDPSGAKAIEQVFGRPLAEVEKEWRRWVASRGTIKDSVSPEDAIMGIQAENSNDGVKITRVLRRTPAANAGLRVGDVIVKIGDETVRSLEEMVIALGRRTRGDPIEVGYRRRGEYRSATLVETNARPALAP
ncbi:MAG: PDZ domain-containing protein, partial [Phycisphaerae bacterium]|nr:PDZ domain-containing protein [Phycisphaerae bacterium]